MIHRRTVRNRRLLVIAHDAPHRNPVPPGAFPTPYAQWLMAVVRSGAMDRDSGLLIRDVRRPDGTWERRQAVRTEHGVRVLDWRLSAVKSRLRDWRDGLRDHQP